MGAITGTEFSSPSSYTHYETNKTPEFTAKFGYGKVPALDANGFYLTEGIAIARYGQFKTSYMPSRLHLLRLCYKFSSRYWVART